MEICLFVPVLEEVFSSFSFGVIGVESKRTKREVKPLSVGLCIHGMEICFIRLASQWFLDAISHGPTVLGV